MNSIILFSSLPIILVLLIPYHKLDRASWKYRTWWLLFVSAFSAVCLCFFSYVMTIPYYSQVPHRLGGGPDSGFGNIQKGMLFLLFFITVITPSYLGVIALGLLPPKVYSRKKQIAIAAILTASVALMILMMHWKREAYKADIYRYLHPPVGSERYKEGVLLKQRMQREKENRREADKERKEKEESKELERLSNMSKADRAEWEMLLKTWAENTKYKKAKRAERDKKRKQEIDEKRRSRWEKRGSAIDD